MRSRKSTSSSRTRTAKRKVSPRKGRRRRRPLGATDVDHRGLFHAHLAEANQHLTLAERAAREARCHDVMIQLVAAGEQHGMASAHASNAGRARDLQLQAETVGRKLNLLVDTIGLSCLRRR